MTHAPIEPDGTVHVPSAGDPVTLLSHSTGLLYPATVTSWDGGEHGLVVRTRLHVEPEAVELLADHRVWVSALPDDVHDGVTVYTGVAHPAGASAVDVTGVATILRDRRRRTPRSEVDTAVSVRSGRGTPLSLRTIDLSRGGMRVSLPKPTSLTVGEHLDLDVTLDDGADLPATGEVLRVDEASGQAVVRFDDLPDDQGTLIDRLVLGRLTPPRG